MAKLPRVFQKLFGSTGATSDFGQFGSLAGGTAVFTKDLPTIQSLAAFLTGWSAATITNNRPSLEDMNSLFYVLYYQVCYMMQQGVAEWDDETEYHAGSICQVGGALYRSLQNTNVNKDPEVEFAWWALVGQDGPGVIKIIGGSTVPYRSLLCDGTSYLRTDYPRLSAYLAVDSYPFGAVDATHFNVPDFRERSPIGKAASGLAAALGNAFGSLNHVHAETQHAHTYSGTTGSSNSNEGHAGPDNFSLPLPGHGHTYSGTTSTTGASNTGAANGPVLTTNFAITY